MKKLLALFLAISLTLSLVACSSSGEDVGQGASNDSVSDQAQEETPGEVTNVVVAMPYAYETTDLEMVEEAMNAISADKYGITFQLELIGFGNWTQQSNLMLTGDEVDVTAIFATPLTTFVRNSQLEPLDSYYENASDDFKAIWGEEEMQGTTVNGTLYAIPNLRNFGNYFGINIDEDIAAEFGIEEGQTLTMEEVDTFLRAAAAAYPDRLALAPRTGTIMNQWTWDGLGDEKYIGVLEDSGQSTEVKNLFETDDFVDFCTWTRSWYEDGLIMQDILSSTENWQTMILNDQAIAVFDNYGVSGVPGMTRTVIVEPWAVSNSYAALCYAINVNSSNKDAAWVAMEVLYTDSEIITILNNGIEGTHYNINDDGTISYPEGTTGADVGYGMSDFNWVTPYSALSYPLDVNGATYFDDLINFNKNETLKSKALGFAFDTTNVTDQYAACINVMDKYYYALMSGTVDVESTIAQANSELEAAGLDEILVEKQAQLDAFLAG